MAVAKGAARRSFRSRAQFATLYVAYLSLWFVAVHYFVFWRPFVAELRQHRKPSAEALKSPRYVDALTARRLGNINWFPRPLFADFAKTKEAGTTRVCAFGDSFTRGDEVADGHDYPAFLQRQFRRHGFDRVEVINFGGSWYGFHQAYLLWDAVGRQFDCDYVLLGPLSFQYGRDTTFSHTRLYSPYYLHARYVIDGDDVRLVDVLGDTHAQRFDEYVRFVPHWRYLRYDRNAPPTLLAALPKDRTLPNPFYYYPGSVESEALATYRVLLRRLCRSARNTVLLHEIPAVVDAAAATGQPNFVAARSYTADHFPYRAPASHYSAFGNQMVAAQFFAQIVDAPDDRLTVLETSDPPPRALPAEVKPPQPLSSFERIEVRIGDQSVAFPVTVTEYPLRAGAATASSLKDGAINGLLAIKEKKGTWLDAYFTPIDFSLRAGMEMVMRVRDPPAGRDVSLGRVRLLDAQLNIGAVDVDGVRFHPRRGTVLSGNDTIALRALGPPGSQLTVLVDQRAMLRGTAGSDEVELVPLQGNYQIFRTVESQFIDIEALPPSGTFDLVLEHSARGIVRVPIGAWKKGNVAMPRPEHPLAERLRAELEQ